MIAVCNPLEFENLQAFDALHNSRELGLDLESLEALPTRLIAARVAAGLTQKALADQLGVSPQQVQRDEAMIAMQISRGCSRWRGYSKLSITSHDLIGLNPRRSRVLLESHLGVRAALSP